MIEEEFTGIKETTPRRVVECVIKSDQLPAYQEAALYSGFTVRVTAQAGEKFILDYGTQKATTLTVQPGFMAVSIVRPNYRSTIDHFNRGDHTPFWEVLESLREKSNFSYAAV